MPSTLRLPSAAAQQQYSEVKAIETIKGKAVNLHLLKSVDSTPPLSRITSASVIPFVQQGMMVAAVLERGLDIPGGHIEADDGGVVPAIKREAYEEARISLVEPLHLIGVILSDYHGGGPEYATYMLIATGRVAAMDDFVAEFESTGREVVTTGEFLGRYKAGSYEIMEEIIKRARLLGLD